MKPFDLSHWGSKAIQRQTLVGNIITLAGNQGSINIDINGHTKVCTFDTDLATTSEGGTSYGDDVSITTPSSSVPTVGGKVLNKDGKIIIAK